MSDQTDAKGQPLVEGQVYDISVYGNPYFDGARCVLKEFGDAANGTSFARVVLKADPAGFRRPQLKRRDTVYEGREICIVPGALSPA